MCVQWQMIPASLLHLQEITCYWRQHSAPMTLLWETAWSCQSNLFAWISIEGQILFWEYYEFSCTAHYWKSCQIMIHSNYLCFVSAVGLWMSKMKTPCCATCLTCCTQIRYLTRGDVFLHRSSCVWELKADRNSSVICGCYGSFT